MASSGGMLVDMPTLCQGYVCCVQKEAGYRIPDDERPIVCQYNSNIATLFPGALAKWKGMLARLGSPVPCVEVNSILAISLAPFRR